MYVDLVMLLNFVVDLLLILGTNALTGYPVSGKKAVLSAVLGGIYGGICLLPGFYFLGGTLWRVVFLGGMSGIAFGFGRSGLQRCIIFVVLSMALGGIALGLGKGNTVSLVVAALALAAMCFLGFRGKVGQREFCVVKLVHRGKRKHLVALLDTGNTLRDPITGGSVLVVGSAIAEELLGLCKQDLAHPMETMLQSRIPGLRLIPYRSVGQPEGMLLAMKLEEVWIDGHRTDPIVAFAPHRIGTGNWEALAGGKIG